jgi:Methyltransferase domain
MTCEFCNSSAPFAQHAAREMMLGLRTEFMYLECKNCGSLRIAEIPSDLQKYYPAGTYYSFSDRLQWRVFGRRVALKAAAKNRRVLSLLHRTFQIQAVLLMHSFGFEPSMKILDVGSGSGSLIRDLRSAGFRHTMGVDRFLASDIKDGGSVIVKRGTLSDIEGGWDRIILNHSLEHMSDHLDVLSTIRSKLSRKGKTIIRMPLVNWAWQKYGPHWVQLDAPRHLCLHSERSFGLAAKRTGFEIEATRYDSWAYQFWGSELFRRGIPLVESDDRLDRHFTRREIKQFRKRAAELNQKHLGDQAMFVLSVLNGSSMSSAV